MGERYSQKCDVVNTQNCVYYEQRRDTKRGQNKAVKCARTFFAGEKNQRRFLEGCCNERLGRVGPPGRKHCGFAWERPPGNRLYWLRLGFPEMAIFRNKGKAPPLCARREAWRPFALTSWDYPQGADVQLFALVDRASVWQKWIFLSSVPPITRIKALAWLSNIDAVFIYVRRTPNGRACRD